MTQFTPRMLSGLRVCCSNPDALCDACKAHHAHTHGAARSDPPDPYAAGVAQMRAAYARTDVRPPTATPPVAVGAAPPDPYAPGIAAMRSANR